MLTKKNRVRRILVVLGSAGLLITGITLARGSAARTDSGPRVSSASLPADVAGTSPDRPGATSVVTGPAGLSAADRAAVDDASHTPVAPPNKPGRPVHLDIPVSTPNHPNGVHAKVSADHLNTDGTLFVPTNPTQVSWARDDAAPGSARGTAILTSHINYVIDGETVIGALSDLAVYANKAIGKKFSVTLADHRVLKYRIVAGREYTKDQLANDPTLRRTLYDQSKIYGPTGQPSGRLLLVSCGGNFDEYTGEYEDNVFLYALPTT